MKQMGQRLYSGTYITFLLFWLVCLLLYAPSMDAGLYEDMASYIGMHAEKTFREYINYSKLSLYQGYFAYLHILISSFGTVAVLWYILYTGLHALTTFIAYRFFVSLYQFMGWRHPGITLFIGCVLFLVTPLNAEVVIWKACGHYFLSTLSIIVICQQIMLFFKHGRNLQPIVIACVFSASFFFLEIFYIVPILSATLIYAFYRAGKISPIQMRMGIFKILLPICTLFIGYFVLLYAITGQQAGHGTSPISMLGHPGDILEKMNKYMARIYFMDYFFDYSKKQFLYKMLAHKISLIVTGIALIALLIGMINLHKFTAKQQTILLMCVLGTACCITILPTWFYQDFPFQGSRYYYLPALFLLPMGVSLVDYFIKWVTLKRAFALCYISVCIYGTFTLTTRAGAAAKVFNGLIYDFPSVKADTIILLNVPVAYEGHSLIPTTEPSNVNDHISIFTGRPMASDLYEVAGYNMKTANDGAHVLVMDQYQLKVAPNHYGSWWWKNVFGAADYENDLYSFKLLDDGFRYLLTFKRPLGAGTILLYQSGSTWKQVDMQKLNTWQW